MTLSREQLETFLDDWQKAEDASGHGYLAVAASHVPVLVEEVRRLRVIVAKQAHDLAKITENGAAP